MTAQFRFWSQAERDALDAKYFGDPENKLFPVKTQGDLDSAVKLYGKAKDPAKVKRNLIRIAHMLNLTLPDAWKATMSMGDALEVPVDIDPNIPATGVTFAYAYPLIQRAMHARGLKDHVLYHMSRTHVIHGAPGNAKHRTPYALSQGHATLGKPEPVESAMQGDTIAAFSLPAGVRREGDWVIRTGKVFEAGEYPDKAFSITPEQMVAAAQDFVSCHGDLEHVSTLLDGQLGMLRKIELADDGWSLMGEVAIPAWLDEKLPERKVSLSWTRGDAPRVVGYAYTKNPRVTDADLAAAFSNSPQFVEFAGKRHNAEDLAQIQQIHDLASMQGAACAPVAEGSRGGWNPSFSTEGNASMTPEQAAEQARKNAAAAAAAIPGSATTATLVDPAVVDPSATPQFNATQPPAPAAPAAAPIPVPAPAAAPVAPVADPVTATAADFANSPAFKEMQAQMAANNAELARLRAEKTLMGAEAFADKAVRDNQAVPSERQSLIALFFQATEDDRLSGAVHFSDGTTASRIQLLGNLIASRPKNVLTTELVPVPDGAVTMSNPMNTPHAQDAALQPGEFHPSREQVVEMMGKTALGRATLAQIAKPTA